VEKRHGLPIDQQRLTIGDIISGVVLQDDLPLYHYNIEPYKSIFVEQPFDPNELFTYTDHSKNKFEMNAKGEMKRLVLNENGVVTVGVRLRGGMMHASSGRNGFFMGGQRHKICDVTVMVEGEPHEIEMYSGDTLEKLKSQALLNRSCRHNSLLQL
jgi:hypothetical protein